MKDINRMENNSFHSLNVYNTWIIPRSHKKILGPFCNCDADDHIAPKCPLPLNEDNIKREKESHEASHVSISGHINGGQYNNYRGNKMRNKYKSNGGDNKKFSLNYFRNGVQKRGEVWMCY